MGHIRAKAIYSNPRFEFCGIVDSNVEEAAKLGEIYRVRAESIVRRPPCSDKSLSLHFPTSQNHDTMHANTRHHTINHSRRQSATPHLLLPAATTAKTLLWTESSSPHPLRRMNHSSPRRLTMACPSSPKSPSMKLPIKYEHCSTQHVATK